ncbi:MAG TPA: PQQ-binding-like beta-propeller repeat protein [Gemmataceae bacterium]|nr:PQQ-binding-like beta-propeller repeat protein [Gemmataceae bacterium]
MSPRLSLLVLLLFSPVVHGADWPQYRGPNRDGVSTEPGLFKTWPADGPKRAWMIDTLGEGFSGPAVVGDGVFILGTADGQEVALRLNARTGKVLWKTAVGPVFKNSYGNGPRSTPTVAGDTVFALGSGGMLYALDAATGKSRWQVHLRTDLAGKLMKGNIIDVDWGFSESPLVDKDRVIVTPGGKDGTLAALDRATGKVVWRSKELVDNGSYASLGRAEIAGVAQYVVLTGGIEKSIGLLLKEPPKLAGVAAADGKLLWSFAPNYGGAALAVTPIWTADGAYCSLPYGAGCARVTVQNDNGKWQAKKAFANKVMKNYHGGVVRVGDALYGFSEGTGWVAQDWKTGDELWSHKGTPGKGSLVAVGDSLILVTEDGGVFLADASPKGWNDRGKFRLPDVSPARKANGQIGVHTPPVVANGRLYVRDQELLSCYEVGAGK